VSFTKGCYVGQETVARLFYKGKPNRHLRGIRLAAPAEPGRPLTLAGKEVGRITSPVVSPRLGPVALALVRREAPPGTTLDDGSAVVELPFEA
jgi:folate-binding Fe-S cluster repair protein YgfZ